MQQFSLINTLLNLHETSVSSVLAAGSFLFTKAHNEKMLKVTKFGATKPIDMVKHF